MQSRPVGGCLFICTDGVMRWRNSDWTTERTELLKVLHAAGYSARQIAERLRDGFHCITRNAVLGKAFRLHLPRRRNKKTDEPRPRRRRTGKKLPDDQVFIGYDRVPKSVIKPAPMIFTNDRDIPLEQRVTLWDLTNETCRWPIDIVGLPSYHFCGHRSADLAAGMPYCEHHARIAYKPEPRSRMQAAE
jgi:GcrA cell cycle regulator